MFCLGLCIDFFRRLRFKATSGYVIVLTVFFVKYLFITLAFSMFIFACYRIALFFHIYRRANDLKYWQVCYSVGWVFVFLAIGYYLFNPLYYYWRVCVVVQGMLIESLSVLKHFIVTSCLNGNNGSYTNSDDTMSLHALGGNNRLNNNAIAHRVIRNANINGGVNNGDHGIVEARVEELPAHENPPVNQPAVHAVHEHHNVAQPILNPDPADIEMPPGPDPDRSIPLPDLDAPNYIADHRIDVRLYYKSNVTILYIYCFFLSLLRELMISLGLAEPDNPLRFLYEPLQVFIHIVNHLVIPRFHNILFTSFNVPRFNDLHQADPDRTQYFTLLSLPTAFHNAGANVNKLFELGYTHYRVGTVDMNYIKRLEKFRGSKISEFLWRNCTHELHKANFDDRLIVNDSITHFINLEEVSQFDIQILKLRAQVPIL